MIWRAHSSNGPTDLGVRMFERPQPLKNAPYLFFFFFSEAKWWRHILSCLLGAFGAEPGPCGVPQTFTTLSLKQRSTGSRSCTETKDTGDGLFLSRTLDSSREPRPQRPVAAHGCPGQLRGREIKHRGCTPRVNASLSLAPWAPRLPHPGFTLWLSTVHLFIH